MVVRWTGQHVSALRAALRMSVRDFASHTRLSSTAITDLEARGGQARPRYATQDILDTVLEKAPPEARQRFLVLLSDAGLPPIGPAPAASMEVGEPVPEAARFAAGSSARTESLLVTLRAGGETPLPYLAPAGVEERVRDFLHSPSRVYVVKGPPGNGKTRLTHHLAARMRDRLDLQLHSVDVWGNRPVDLAAEILRYASLLTGEDSLLTVERVGAELSRPCLIVLDGVKSQAQADAVGRQVDALLRQVMSDLLRFVLIIRTPPEIDLSAYPVLAASVYTPESGLPGASYRLTPWQPAQAAGVWNSSRSPGQPRFGQLPLPVQQLARTPLYMELLRTAGLDGRSDQFGTGRGSYRLVDHCVQTIVAMADPDTGTLTEQLADLAIRQAPEVVPSRLAGASEQRIGTEVVAADLPLLRASGTGGPTFSHDVLREYFLAYRIADCIIQSGRSTATVSALNELAAGAATTATARGVFDFTVCRLDVLAPDLLAGLAMSPTIRVDRTLPLLIDVVGARLGPEVLRAVARRCTQEHSVELSRSLVATPALAGALGDHYTGWVMDLLRRFGADIWSGLAGCVEQSLDAGQAGRLLAAANLDDPDEATFFARHYVLFGDTRDPAEALGVLLSHQDWRVRAALAEGIPDAQPVDGLATGRILDTLAKDVDYKVRAAVARGLGSLDLEPARRHLPLLLTDDNWYVRGCALQGLLAPTHRPQLTPSEPLAVTATDIITTDPSWWECPAQVAVMKHRLLLLHDQGADGGGSPAEQRALFGLLREQRTGAIRVPAPCEQALLRHARTRGNWLVRREAEALARHQFAVEASHSPNPPETVRRLRDRRAVQVALDLPDLDHAVRVAKAAAAAGVELIEVGDPLIKHAGLRAIAQVKREVPGATVVAEMMSADWGRDQVVMAAEAGADVVLLIGPATAASVVAAVTASRRLGVPILLDIPRSHGTQAWIRDMERVGVDGFSITTNIDLGVAGRHPLDNAAAVRGWTRLPVAVSGGFSPTDHTITSSRDWDILIVGRSIVEAVAPETAARGLLHLVRGGGGTTPG